MLPIKKNHFTSIVIFSFVVFANTTNAQQVIDKEIKKDVVNIENPLTRLVKLEPKSFTYDNAKHNYLSFEKGKQYGFIAEDVKQTFPELVNEKNVQYMFGKNVYRTAKLKTIDDVSLIPILVASIKEQQLQIEKLKQEVEMLKNNRVSAAE